MDSVVAKNQIQTKLKRFSVLKGCLDMIEMKFVCIMIDETCIAIKKT